MPEYAADQVGCLSRFLLNHWKNLEKLCEYYWTTIRFKSQQTSTPCADCFCPNICPDREVLLLQRSVQRWVGFSGETWAVLKPPGWLRYKRALYYPVIYPYIRNVRIMIGHMTFCGALHDFPTMTPRTLDWCCFFFFSLARMITRSQSFVAEHPQHGLSRCQSPVFKVIHLWNKYVFFYLEGFFLDLLPRVDFLNHSAIGGPNKLPHQCWEG